MDIANQMILFAKVVESEGFSAAARDLGLTPSAVSRQIGHLEDHLGTRLLNRSTRKVSLTMVGTQFYKRCVEVDRNVTDAEALVLSLVDHPQGVMNVSSTSAFAKSQLMPLLPEFLELNPDLKISLELSDRAIDLVEDQIDVAIRFTEQVNDISVVAHKLAANQRVFCASPAYIEAHGMPMSPVELSQHNCLRLSTLDAFNTWDLGDSDHKRLQLINGNFEINSTDGLYHAALSGLGIARISTYLVNNAVREGKLVHVLPDHIEDDSSILAIFSNKKNLSPNVRAFVDFLARKFGPTPPWEKV